jgi:peptide/nickel transport system permease protein
MSVAAQLPLGASASPDAGASRTLGRRLMRNTDVIAGGAILIVIGGLCLFGPMLWAKSPDAIDFTAFGQAPNLHHLMGTDDLGRDEFTRILYGGRISLLVGVMAMLIGIGFGGLVGAVSGWFGGAMDFAIMRLVDIALSIPSLFLLLLLSVVIPPGSFSIAFVIGAVNWMRPARLMRAQVLIVKPLEYVEAAYALGSSPARILFRTVTPNAISPLIVAGTLLVGHAIVIEAAMSFLGFGIQPPTPSWGNMLSDAQNFYQVAWWYLVFPAAALLITTLAFNLLGDGIRDAMDPRTERLIAARRLRRRLRRSTIKRENKEALEGLTVGGTRSGTRKKG